MKRCCCDAECPAPEAGDDWVTLCRLTDALGAPMAANLARVVSGDLEQRMRVHHGAVMDTRLATGLATEVSRAFAQKLVDWGQDDQTIGTHWLPAPMISAASRVTLADRLGPQAYHLARTIDLIVFEVVIALSGAEITDSSIRSATTEASARTRMSINNRECRYNRRSRRKEWYENGHPTGIPCYE